mgnify:CR=1 FL=1
MGYAADTSVPVERSRAEIERIERYHAEYLNGEDKPFSSPLFGTRSLFRAD